MKFTSAPLLATLIAASLALVTMAMPMKGELLSTNEGIGIDSSTQSRRDLFSRHEPVRLQPEFVHTEKRSVSSVDEGEKLIERETDYRFTPDIPLLPGPPHKRSDDELERRLMPAYETITGSKVKERSDDSEESFSILRRDFSEGNMNEGAFLSEREEGQAFMLPGEALIRRADDTSTKPFCKGRTTMLFGAKDYNIDSYGPGKEYTLIYCSGMVEPWVSNKLNTYFVPRKGDKGKSSHQKKVNVLSNIKPNNLPQDVASPKHFSYDFTVTVPDAPGYWYYVIEEIWTIPGEAGKKLGPITQTQSYPVYVGSKKP